MNIETLWKNVSISKAREFESFDEGFARYGAHGLSAEEVWKIISRVL